MIDPHIICIDLYGECKCILEGRDPCEAMIALADNGMSAADEMERIEAERADAENELI